MITLQDYRDDYCYSCHKHTVFERIIPADEDGPEEQYLECSYCGNYTPIVF